MSIKGLSDAFDLSFASFPFEQMPSNNGYPFSAVSSDRVDMVLPLDQNIMSREQAVGFAPHKISLGSDDQVRREVGALCVRWKCFTAEMQSHLSIVLKKMKKQGKLTAKNSPTPLLDDILSSRQDEQPINEQRIKITENFMTAFRSLLRINNLGAYLLKELNDLRNKRASRPTATQRREKQFERLNALHPAYKHYYQMSQCYGETMDYQQDSAPSELYRPPRLFVRGEELQEYMNPNPISGILLISVEGSYVAGKRGLAIANGNSIEWWIHRGEYNGIIGQLEPIVPSENGDSVNPPQPPPPPPPTKRKHDGQLELQFKFMGHHGNITALSLSYDEFFLLSAATDNVIKLWCLRSKMVLTQYKGHSCAIWSVSFSPCGYFFLSSGGDKTIRMWRTDSPIPVRILLGHQSDVYKAEFMKNPDYVISCSGDRSIRMWDVQTADCIRTIYFDREVINFTVSFSGRFLVSCQVNGTMTLIDILNGHEINSFNLFFLKRNKDQPGQLSYPIHDLDFSPDEKQFACVTKKEVAVYSLEAMKEKLAVNVYDVLKEDGSKAVDEKQHSLRPKQVLDLGAQLNLIYCRYHAKNQLVVAGKK